jgi:KipI family sensor histidine kinase inhibitor
MTEPAQRSVRFTAASDSSLLVYFGHEITRENHERVRRLLHFLEAHPVAGVRNLHPAYASLLVDFDVRRMRHEEVVRIVSEGFARAEEIELPEPRLVEIPVCYGGAHGPDLESVAAEAALAPERVIELHASATYTVYFLGFVPGFAYLGELQAALALPRLATPRRSVAPGSVGIAGRQTGVYPLAAPGGWRLIGRTPLAMFEADREEMSLLAMGDRVRFVPISAERFAALAGP